MARALATFGRGDSSRASKSASGSTRPFSNEIATEERATTAERARKYPLLARSAYALEV
jgi:hypothetical protein